MSKQAKRATFTDAVRKAILDAKAAGWSRYAIAKRLETSEGSLHGFCRGRYGVSSELLDKLADLLGLRVVVDPRRRKAPPRNRRKS